MAAASLRKAKRHGLRLRPHPRYRVDGRDVYVDLPLAPWEAALGASLTVPIPEGSVELTIPANSVGGRKLRLKGHAELWIITNS